jgi:hypothetical protein
MTTTILLLTFLIPVAAAQTGDPTTDLAMASQLKSALSQIAQVQASQKRFTRFRLEHNVNTLNNGRVTADTLKLFEDTWINDLPYEQLVEFNDKPLTGKDLANEQARYDKAVADRRALDAKERSRLTGGRLIQGNLELSALTGPGYHVQVRSTEDCSGSPCEKFEIDPVLTGPNTPDHPFHVEVWVAVAGSRVLKIRWVYLANDGDQKKGSTSLLEWQIFDGVLVLKHSLFESRVRLGLRSLHIRTENTYSRYRKFETSVTISPASEGSVPIPPPQ